MTDKDFAPTRQLTLGERLDRLEDIAMLLAIEASHGQGSMGQPFWAFIDTIRAERQALAQHMEC